MKRKHKHSEITNKAEEGLVQGKDSEREEKEAECQEQDLQA